MTGEWCYYEGKEQANTKRTGAAKMTTELFLTMHLISFMIFTSIAVYLTFFGETCAVHDVREDAGCLEEHEMNICE